MPAKDGPWQNKGRIQWEYSVPTPTAGQTSITVSATAYLQIAAQWYIDDNVDVYWSGEWGSGSSRPKLTIGNLARAAIRSTTFSVSLSDTATSVSIYIQADQYFGLSYDTLSIAIPARVYNAPAVPGTPTVTRVSDTSHTIDWSRAATAAAPYTSQQVQRSKLVAGSWSAWSAVAAIATTYTDSGTHSFSDTTESDSRYKYRIKAANLAGESFSAESALVFTTPGAPTSVVATKLSNTSVKVDITPKTADALLSQELEYRIGTGAWTPLVTLSPGVVTHTWNSVPGGSSVTLRSKSVVASSGSVGNGLASGFTTSNVIPLTAPPNPPTNLSPNGVAFDATTPRLFQWIHNPADSSEQSAYEIEYRVVGAGAFSTTGKQTSAASQASLSLFTNGNDYEWRSRTWGVHADPSNWSATATFTASQPPLVSISSPTPVYTSPVLVVDWVYTDSEGTLQSMYEIHLLQGGLIIESVSRSGSDTTATLATRLLNEETYQVGIRVRDGSGLWSEQDFATFEASFPPPTTPTGATGFNEESGEVYISVTNPEPVGGQPATDHNEVFRSTDGGTTWVLLGRTSPNGLFFDREVSIGLDEVLYKIVAWSDLPSTAESSAISESTITLSGYWSAGDAFSEHVRIRLNVSNKPPKMDLSTGLHTKVLHYFAGRQDAVETVGSARAVDGSVEFVVATQEELFQARQMATLPAPHLIRLPDTTLVYASIGPVSDSRLHNGWYRITFPVRQVSR